MNWIEQHALSLKPRIGFSRRGFVTSSVAAGFALAVQPVSADTIITDTNGLAVGDVAVPVTDGTIPGYYAMPGKGGPFHTVLVIQEIFGLHEHIKDICRRLAKAGYFACSASLYARQGDVSNIPDIQTILQTVVSKVPDSQVASDLDALLAWAKSTGKADTSRVAVTGFCWGGRQTWLYAAHNPRLRAAVAWYGPISPAKGPNTPANPIDIAATLTVPVLGLYGGADQGISVDSVHQMDAALKAAKEEHEIVIYPDAPHGFNADYRPSYREGPAKDGWKRMLAWFKKHGV